MYVAIVSLHASHSLGIIVPRPGHLLHSYHPEQAATPGLYRPKEEEGGGGGGGGGGYCYDPCDGRNTTMSTHITMFWASAADNWQMIALTTFTCLKLPLSPWSCDKVNGGQGLM